jgi:23S rRNA pseudouridine2605 synthase
VRAHGDTDQAKLDALRGGVTIDGVEYAGIDAKMDRAQGSNVWLTMGLREGKNREVKRVLEHIGLDVNRLIRISFGPFQLGELAEGAVEEIKTRILRDQLGEALAAEAKVDFDAPVFDHAAESQQDERAPRPRREERRDERPRRDAHERPRDGERAYPRNVERADSREGERVPREAIDEPQKPRIDRPKPASRKHVKTIRTERTEDVAKGTRKRIERNETADRRGRAVKVERVVPASGVAGEKATRNARRFDSERRPDHEEDARHTPRRDGAERPDRPFEKRGFRDRDAAPGGDRPPRRESAGFSKGPRRYAAPGEDRPPRREGAGFSKGPRRDAAPGGDRPPRREGAGFSKGPRRDAAPGGDRPPRREGAGFSKGPRRDAAPGGDRPPRREGTGFSKGPRREEDRPSRFDRAPSQEGEIFKAPRGKPGGGGFKGKGDGFRGRPRDGAGGGRSDGPPRGGPRPPRRDR